MQPAGTTRRSQSPSPARIPSRASPRASSRRTTGAPTAPQPRSPELQRPGRERPKRAFGLKYDATAPQATPPQDARRTRTAGTTTRSLSCSRAQTRRRDSVRAMRRRRTRRPTPRPPARGTCRDSPGTRAHVAFAFKYDATSPSVTAAPSRQPDANGWYNHAARRGLHRQRPDVGRRSCDARRPTAARTTPPPGRGNLPRPGREPGRRILIPSSTTRPPRRSPRRASRAPNANGWFNRAARRPSR